MLCGTSRSYISWHLQLLKRLSCPHRCLHTGCWIPKLLSRLMLPTMHLELSFLSILQILISISSHSISTPFPLRNSTMTFTTKNFSQFLRHSRFSNTTWRVHIFQWTSLLTTKISPTFPPPRSSLAVRLIGLNICLNLTSLFISVWAASEQSQMLSLDIQMSIQKGRIVATLIQICTTLDSYSPKINFSHHSMLSCYFFLFFVLYLFSISNHFYLISILLTLLTLSPLPNFLNFLYLLIPLILPFLLQCPHLHLSAGHSSLLIFSFSMDLSMFLILQTSTSRCLGRNMIISCQATSVRLRLWD